MLGSRRNIRDQEEEWIALGEAEMKTGQSASTTSDVYEPRNSIQCHLGATKTEVRILERTYFGKDYGRMHQVLPRGVVSRGVVSRRYH